MNTIYSLPLKKLQLLKTLKKTLVFVVDKVICGFMSFHRKQPIVIFTSHLGVKNGLVVFHNSNKLASAPFTPILQDLRYLYLLLTSMFSFAQQINCSIAGADHTHTHKHTQQPVEKS